MNAPCVGLNSLLLMPLCLTQLRERPNQIVGAQNTITIVQLYFEMQSHKLVEEGEMLSDLEYSEIQPGKLWVRGIKVEAKYFFDLIAKSIVQVHM